MKQHLKKPHIDWESECKKINPLYKAEDTLTTFKRIVNEDCYTDVIDNKIHLILPSKIK
jgi:hypothetical protein